MLHQTSQQLLELLRGGYDGLYHDKLAQLGKVLYEQLGNRGLSDRERVRVYCVYHIVCDVQTCVDGLFSSAPTTEAHNQLSAACFDPLSNLFESIDSADVTAFEDAAATAILACT